MEKVYCAMPFRLKSKKKEIINFVKEHGYEPLHPFDILPPSEFNYDNYPRKNIMEMCFGLIDRCNQLWIFGLASGSIEEWLYARNTGKQTRSFVTKFDGEWKNFSDRYIKKYGNVIKEILK